VSIGTPAYMSPEQAAGAKDLDSRSDQCSLACVVYEMLAGQPLFTGPTAESVVHQHLAAAPPSVMAARAAATILVVGIAAHLAFRPETSPPDPTPGLGAVPGLVVLPFENLGSPARAGGQGSSRLPVSPSRR